MSGSNRYRMTDAVNLFVGIVLVLLGTVGLISIRNISGPSLAVSFGFVSIFVFVGGRKIGKYAENRQSKER